MLDSMKLRSGSWKLWNLTSQRTARMDVPKPYFVSGFIPTLYIYIRDDMPAKKTKKTKKREK